MPLEPFVAPHTIVLIGDLAKYHKEANAGGTIYPGYLVKFTSTATVVAHATAGGDGSALFAKENALRGFGIADAYSSNDTTEGPTAGADVVLMHHAQKGDLLQVVIAAAATALAIGDPMTSAGDGTMKKASGSDVIYGYSAMAIDNSAGSSPVFGKMTVK